MRKLKLLIPVIALLSFVAACKKEDKTPTTNNPTTTGCGDGNICFKLGGSSLSKAGGGYYFADTFLFVKYEEGVKQLSIDIFGKNNGAYTISNIRKAGNARIYWFADANNTMYMASKGSLSLSELTSDNKVTGTFSGTLYKYNSNNDTYNYTDSVVITDGNFTKVQLVKQ
jgi:hypothetical protein